MDMIRYTPLDTHIRMPANIRYDILKAVREREYKNNFYHRYAPWFIWSYFRATHPPPSLRVYKSIPVNTEGSYIQLVLQPNNLYRLKPAPLLRAYKSIPVNTEESYIQLVLQPNNLYRLKPTPLLRVYKSIPATAWGFGYLESCPFYIFAGIQKYTHKHRRHFWCYCKVPTLYTPNIVGI